MTVKVSGFGPDGHTTISRPSAKHAVAMARRWIGAGYTSVRIADVYGRLHDPDVFQLHYVSKRDGR